jgi:hypothetical protein
MGSRSVHPAGWNSGLDGFALASLTGDGINQLIRTEPPVPTGLEGAGAVVSDRPTRANTLDAALELPYSAIHLDIRSEAALHPGQKLDPVTLAGMLRQYFLEGRLVDWASGSQETKSGKQLHRYKSCYVHAMRAPIMAAAARFDLPAVLLAGMVYGHADAANMLEPFALFRTRRILGPAPSHGPFLGPLRLQPERVLAALGYDPATVDPLIRQDVEESLQNDHAFAIYVCAKAMSDLRETSFATGSAGNLTEGDIITLGTWSDPAEGTPAEPLRKDLRWGKTIIERRAWLQKLLSSAPVSAAE